MKIHVLKTIQPYFSDLQNGKNFELRKNDRDYKTNDILILREFDPEKNEFKNEFKKGFIIKKINYIFESKIGEINYGLQLGYCILGLDLVEFNNPGWKLIREKVKELGLS